VPSLVENVVARNEIQGSGCIVGNTDVRAQVSGYILRQGHKEGAADSLRAEEIRRRAYEIYLERGGQSEREMGDWLQAERELDHATL